MVKRSLLRSPIVWFGGKGNMVAKLLPLVPPHKVYVEVFGGAAALLFAKEPSLIEVYNDIDEDLVNLFRVLRDREQFIQFWQKVMLTLYSRAEREFCHRTYQEIDMSKDPVERAYRFFVAVRQSFSGKVLSGGWGYGVEESYRGMAGTVSKWLSIRDLLPQIHLRLQRVQIERNDWRKILQTYDTEETFFYLDPPYVPSVRKSGEYKYEISEKDHEELVDYLLNLKGKWLLSGYPNEIYKRLENNGIKKIEFKTVCHGSGRTRLNKILGKGAALERVPRIEAVWFNYEVSSQNIKQEKIFDLK